MKCRTLFDIFEKAEKFDIAVCCKLYVALYGSRDFYKLFLVVCQKGVCTFERYWYEGHFLF